MQILRASEDYLEAMLMMQQEHGYIRSIDIADKLGVTKPSVTYATKRLRENGYITMDKDGLITLTERGMSIAASMLDRHHTLTRFLMALGGMADGGLLPVLLAAAVCMLISMNDMTAPSVSLEGKSLWLAQSLPVTPWQVLRAKMVMQLLLTGIPAAVCLLCAVLAISMTAAEAVLLAAVCLLFVVLSAMLGLFLGLKMPNLTWTSEITPIKQSACVGIALLGGWAYALLLGGGYLLAGWHLGAALYMGCFAAATLAACAVLYLWLKKRGGAVLAAL